MASTVNSVPAANSASGNAVNTPSQTSTGRPSLRTTSSKMSDGGRRQSGSPFDGGARRSNSHKAWSQGTNPITQRSSYAQHNGSMPPPKASAPSNATSKESNTPDNHAHDRLVFLLTSFIGLNATITTKSGEKFTGIFSSSSLEPNDSSFILKMVQRPTKSDQQRANGTSDAVSPFLGSAPDHSMSFDIKDVVDIDVPNVSTSDVTAKTSNGAAVGFKTDTDISGNFAMRERTLKRWEPAADTEIDMSLESAAASTGWDQFETNERLFGATSSYDENIYTTRIDRSDPTYKRREAEAARIAREIEGTEIDNAHVREERGVVPVDDSGLDEEDKYSGVRRSEKNFPPLISGQPNKYTPPARRQPAAQPTTTPEAPSSLKQMGAVSKDTIAAPAPAKETVTTQPQTAPPTTKAAEAEQQPVPVKAAPPTVSAPKRPAAENATANVEAEVLDHFRQFANSEKLKLQERRRNQASYDRTVKLNELMKFSKNFKLATPVPKDLVPILAKDPQKQEEIIQRAQLQAEEKLSTKSSPSGPEQKPAARATGTAVPPTQPDRSNYPRGRQAFPPSGPHAGPGGRPPHQGTHPGRPGTGMLSHRLADNLQQRKGGAVAPAPAPLPISDARVLPSGPAGDQSGVSSPNKTHTPTSAASTKFNVRAMEFKPNPAASTFTPGVASSSSSPFVRGRSVSRVTSPSIFFGTKKPRPISERPSIRDQFNPIKRMKKESSEQSDKGYTFNGGIPPAYKTLPTWDVSPANEEKTYLQMFKQPAGMSSISPQSRSASNPQAPHQAPMPFQFQQTVPGMPPASGPPHGPHNLHLQQPQQHHGAGPGHFDDHHRMQMSASTSQVFPSPRMQHGYPSPMVPHAQLAFGQPVPQFYVNQGGPQPPHMRHFPGAPQFVSPQTGMGAPMMAQQPSSGPYMGGPQGMTPYTPQMQMYSPNPGHAYPQHAPPPQPHSGYPSPSRGAPMMMHQNSQPGQPPQPVMFMSPGQHGQPVYGGQQPGHIPPVRGNYPQQQSHFQSSPHQSHHYPPHQHRNPSNGFNQVPQMPPQMPSQPPSAVPSNTQASEAADEAK